MPVKWGSTVYDLQNKVVCNDGMMRESISPSRHKGRLIWYREIECNYNLLSPLSSFSVGNDSADSD